ncbi:hypothetical protein [Actinomadura flavalba]|uniref:hypothetical protein n=1 Tax=Actinomadura flavalba TaxID=1120938 RepID=UPI00036EF9E7|nr:hypothetical protein [Actinomadura flavalba]
MTRADPALRAAVERAAGDLAVRAARALRDPGGPYAVGDPAEDEPITLAAVRVLGPDALAPFLLAGARPAARDVDLVERGHADPLAVAAPGSRDALVHDLRDAAARHALTLLHGPPRAVPARLPVTGSAAPLEDARRQGRRPWAALMVLLAPLTACPAASPAHDQARRHATDLGRAAVRAVLRRDPATAARLVRWLALPDVSCPQLDLAPLVRHLALTTAPTARAALDVAIAERLLHAAGTAR